ncbi:MAG: prolipoprotein diacylglyceryl transferase [Candidatus Curtissbacteria bacterium]|nr:prolipoprotein diacylglyceryl transferase [Candidatus Curtissbacteria bacterium]
MLPESISIGPLTLHFYGLIIAISIYLGWLLAKRRAPFYKIPPSLLDEPILLIPLLFSIIGARLYHVMDYWDVYIQDLKSIIYISSGGLGIWGALAGAFIGFWIVAKVKKINLLALLDLSAPSLLLGQAIGRIGNYINQEGFGPPTNLSWGVYINPENRPAQFLTSTHFHPTFFYEAILNLLFFFLILKLSKRKRPGQVFALYLILYSTGRFLVEFFRIDTATIDSFKIAQLLSVITILVGMRLLVKFK